MFEAPPGAGKTTKVPLALLWDHLKKSNNGNQEQQRSSKTTHLIVVEPRRVAARSAAVRMAKLLEESVGDTVGYVIRGESHISSKTRITVMTDGVLLQKLRQDPELQGIDVVLMTNFMNEGLDPTRHSLWSENRKSCFGAVICKWLSCRQHF